MTVTLMGPADADHFRVKVGRYRERWYTDPLPGCAVADPIEPGQHWPSISAVKPPFANPYVAMRRVADMPGPEWFRLADADPDSRYDAIKSHDRRTGRVAMDRGTIVHGWAEDLIAGRQPSTPLPDEAATEAAAYLPALQAFFDAWQPEPVAVEAVTINRGMNGYGYGGTCDLIARIDGKTWIVDWKTRGSDHAAYLEEAAQVAGYGAADYMIIQHVDGHAARAPIPDLDGGLIVSIRADGYRVYPVDFDQAAPTFERMHAWWCAQRDHDSIGHPWQPRHIAVTEPEPKGAGFHQRIGQLRTRLQLLVETTGATKETVLDAWPDGCYALTADPALLGDNQLDRIEAAVDLLEADHGMIVVDSVDDVTARLRALPSDLFAAVEIDAKRANVPNLLGGSVARHHIDTLQPLLVKAETAAHKRLVELVDATEAHDRHAIIDWATESDPKNDLGALNRAEADRVLALASFYDAVNAADVEDTPDGIEAWLFEKHGTKTGVLKTAKQQAKLHGLTVPRSAAMVAADRMLAALTHQQPTNTEGTN